MEIYSAKLFASYRYHQWCRNHSFQFDSGYSQSHKCDLRKSFLGHGVEELLFEENAEKSWITSAQPPQDALFEFPRNTNLTYFCLNVSSMRDGDFCPERLANFKEFFQVFFRIRIELGTSRRNWFHKVEHQLDAPNGWLVSVAYLIKVTNYHLAVLPSRGDDERHWVSSTKCAIRSIHNSK